MSNWIWTLGTKDTLLNYNPDSGTFISIPIPIKIKKVIFNNPATIIYWTDNTKTVVKAGESDKFDPEIGFAMAAAKKMLGDNFHSEMKKWIQHN